MNSMLQQRPSVLILPDEINDNDEYFHAEFIAAYNWAQKDKPREISTEVLERLQNTSLKRISIDQIVDDFACSICQDTCKEPMVIKHCLHFFCKECIDKNILRFKKECPLCKIQLKTKRETRYYDKLKSIMKLLNTQLHEYSQQHVNEYETMVAQNKQQMQDLQIMQERKRQSQSEEESGSQGQQIKMQRIDQDGTAQILQTTGDPTFKSQNERLGSGDYFEDEEDKRIKETVEKLKKNKERIQRQKDQLSRKELEYSNLMREPETNEEYLERDYKILIERLAQRKEAAKPKVVHGIPKLDIQVKVLFDEDLTTMIFPQIQTLEFNVSADSPLEICAKLLAIQNGHAESWQNYEFGFCQQQKQLSEIKLTDLKSTFGQIQRRAKKGKHLDDNLLIYYKVKNLKQLLEQNNMNI